MTTRIEQRYAALEREGRAALVTFVTAGDPDHATSLEILRALPKSGADIIELGMPFSDPMADGPTIQASSQRALKAGQTLTKTLEMVRSFRHADSVTPIVSSRTSLARRCTASGMSSQPVRAMNCASFSICSPTFRLSFRRV